MSVYKTRKSPYYQYDFQRNGVRFHGSTGKTTERAALAHERGIRNKLDSPAAPKRPQLQLQDAIPRYFEEKVAGTKTAKATKTQLETIGALLGPETFLSEIDDNLIARMVAHRRGMKARRKRTFVSNATVNRETELLRRLMRRAHKVWKVDTGEEMPDWSEHLLPEAEERVRELTQREETALFDNLREDFRPLVLFAILSGMRLNNVIRLTWNQIDFDTATLTYRVKSKRPGGRTVRTPITTAMRAVISNQSFDHPIYVFTYLCKRSRGLRRKGHRYPFSATGWRREWKAALAAAGIEDFRFHDMRHTAGSRLMRQTGNVKLVQQLLGHRDIASTLRYVHVTQDDLAQAMEATHSRNSPGMPDAPERKALKR